MRSSLCGLLAAAAACLNPAAAGAETVSVLFVGNSYTFGRVDPVMSYNAGQVHDLTAAMWAANPSGSNAFEPHPWGGVPGIFKQFTVQAGLDYEVSLSTRNAASLRGHFLNTNAAGWDLRGNIGAQAWDKVVLQEQSDESLPRQPGLSSNPDWFRNYVDKIEDFVHQGSAHSYRERDFFPGATTAEQTAACQAATGSSATSCNTLRNIPANPFASAATQLYLYQTWARPNLVNGAFVTTTDSVTGAVTRTTTPATTFYGTLAGMTEDLRLAALAAAALAAADGTGGLAGIAPVGETFQRAVNAGRATADMWAPGAASDGLIDLWFDDGTHASKYGSYLSALTLFGTLTGLDPLTLGAGEVAAADLGISPFDALLLQQIASEQLGFTPAVPEPASAGLLAAGLLLIAARRRRRLRLGLALAAIAPWATAQGSSSVTVFGVLDLAATQLRASGAASQKLLNGDGNTSSRFGLRGSEDLGGGLKANFWIESAINVDTGTSGATSTNNIDSVNTGGLTWGRRATVGLQGRWGELRAGRDYVPSFSNLTTSMHPFGTNGVGSSGLLFYPVNAGGTTVRTTVRASNSLGYFLPDNLGGVYGALMVASGEQTGSSAGRYTGLRLGYRAGALNLAAASGRTRYVTGDFTQTNVGINYQFGPAKAMFLWGRNEVGSTRTATWMVGTQWQVGTGEWRLAYTKLKATNVASDASQIAVGYVHDLSKRTSLYATVSQIDNEGSGTRFNVGLSPVTPGGTSSGAELGVRHSF